jgi:hypothetical protein
MNEIYRIYVEEGYKRWEHVLNAANSAAKHALNVFDLGEGTRMKVLMPFDTSEFGPCSIVDIKARQTGAHWAHVAIQAPDQLQVDHWYEIKGTKLCHPDDCETCVEERTSKALAEASQRMRTESSLPMNAEHGDPLPHHVFTNV